MKKLLSTTALVVALGFPAMTLGQTTTGGAAQQQQQTATQQRNVGQSGFLTERRQSDVLASDLMGHDVHAPRTVDDARAPRREGARNPDGTYESATMTRDEMDQMETIGQINEIVLSNDGQVRGLVIGVGGFLGMGERDIGVTMDQVMFSHDADDRSQMYIIMTVGADTLQDAPEYDRTATWSDDDARRGGADRTAARTDDDARRTETNRSATRTGAADRSDGMRGDRSPFAAPDVEREGYTRVDGNEVSTEMLMGKTVYDVNDNSVGSVTDMILDEDGAVTNVIIDFGGFLGIGQSQASLDFDELTIMSTDGYSDVRLYVDATKEQIQNLPRHSRSN